MGLLNDVWNGITGTAGAILNPIGTIANLGMGVANLRHAEKVDEQNYQAQLQANQINQQNNEFNQNMATQQFNEQQYLNRNANQIAVADMAKAGLNPMAGNASSGMTAGGVQASQSQISPAMKGSASLSAMAQLASDTNNRKIANDANKNSLAIAQLTDKNTMIDLMGKLVDKGIDPKIIEDEFKKAGLNIDFAKAGQYSGNISDVAGDKYWSNIHDTKHKARVSRDEDTLGISLDALNTKFKDPLYGLSDIDWNDSSSVLKAITVLIRMLK